MTVVMTMMMMAVMMMAVMMQMKMTIPNYSQRSALYPIPCQIQKKIRICGFAVVDMRSSDSYYFYLESGGFFHR